MINLDAKDLLSLDVTKQDIEDLIKAFNIRVSVNLPDDFFSGAACGVFRVLRKRESLTP